MIMMSEVVFIQIELTVPKSDEVLFGEDGKAEKPCEAGKFPAMTGQ
jgi:hypothetical protein